MKNVIKINLSFLLLCFLSVVSCTKDNNISKKEPMESFDYPIEMLYGKWKITHVYSNGEFSLVPELTEDTISFNKNGTYEGTGVFWSAEGNYKTKGNIVTCYMNGVVFINFEFISLLPTNCEIKMYNPNAPNNIVKIRCSKVL